MVLADYEISENEEVITLQFSDGIIDVSKKFADKFIKKPGPYNVSSKALEMFFSRNVVIADAKMLLELHEFCDMSLFKECTLESFDKYCVTSQFIFLTYGDVFDISNKLFMEVSFKKILKKILVGGPAQETHTFLGRNDDSDDSDDDDRWVYDKVTLDKPYYWRTLRIIWPSVLEDVFVELKVDDKFRDLIDVLPKVFGP